MELNKLYEIADKENIPVVDFKMKNKAIIGCAYDTCSIGLNYSNIDNSSEEKTILAEELGHYYTNSLYDSSTSIETIDKKEFRAKKWAFKTLVPIQKLNMLAEEGCKYSYEFAEELGVTEELVNSAYDYYKCNNVIKY